MVSDWNGSISATTRPIATINTSIQRSIHCASNHEKRGEKALQTSEIHCKTWRKASCRLSKTKRDRSRSVEQLRSSFFLEWKGFFFLVTSSIEFKAIRVTITIGNACSLRDAGPRSRIDRKSERFSLSWSTSNKRYSSSSRRIFTNKVSPFRLGKDLSIRTFRFKIRAKMTAQRCSKTIVHYWTKFDWPGIKGLKSDLKWPQTKSAKRPDHYRSNSNDRFMIKGGNSINRYRVGSLPRYKYTYMYQYAQPRLDSSEHV